MRLVDAFFSNWEIIFYSLMTKFAVSVKCFSAEVNRYTRGENQTPI